MTIAPFGRTAAIGDVPDDAPEAAAAVTHAPLQRVHVHVRARSAARREALERMVEAWGHVTGPDAHDADVVLTEGDGSSADESIVLASGAPQGDYTSIQRGDQASTLAADSTPAQIDAALRAVALGLVVRSAPASADDGFAALGDESLRPLLTPREIEVLAAMAAGGTNKMIARQLDISLHTVKFHVESVFRKLGVRTRAEAVAKGIERQRRETIEL